MFSFITLNWRGRPLTSIRTIVELIAATATKTGLTIPSRSTTPPNTGKVGVKISDAETRNAIPLDPTRLASATGTTPSAPHETTNQIRGGP